MTKPESEDPVLTRLVRAGDERAVSELYERHYPAVIAFARRLCQDLHTAEDLASEAFARTLRTVRSGPAGPTGDWRPYLYAVVRNTAAEWARSDQRFVLTDEFREDDLTTAAPEPSDDLVTRAYRSLPPRWQTVLWHTLIENEEPERVAKILGITSGNVGVLAFRAREGLRKAYLAAHVSSASPRCQEYAEPLAAIVRKRSGRLPRALRAHLESCASCARAHTELLDLNATLRAALPIALFPLALEAGAGTPGTAGAGTSAAASKGAAMPGWAIPVSGAAAVIAAAVAVFGLSWDPAPSPPTRAAAPSPSASPTPKPTRVKTRAPTRVKTPTVRVTTPRPASRSPRKPTPQPGTRIAYAGRCVGAAGGLVAALPCADPRTAWRMRGGAQRFQLVNVADGRCLAAGEQYDTVAFNGGGMLAVRLRPCSSAPAQRWHRPAFSDGVRRLVSVPSGKALSIGKEFAGKRPPTAFILYGPYTGSADQRVTLVDG
ncbi:sigma-70 family RNA polymerase sigma factor [Streptosporangium amethystogenes]|uniref:sigma-70 family RNA polymerase sigma factor n=1 Tax=Streptosporangium amethystogenes TaxID=2002 RepID=UPI000691D6FE|nr:sigma-70 family RNA polymerase sigma factor [Streptosporangium amethystogenes]